MRTSWWLRTVNDPDEKIVIHSCFVGRVVCGGIGRIAGHGGELPADQSITGRTDLKQRKVNQVRLGVRPGPIALRGPLSINGL
jgi:hypothetical protein